MSEKIENGKLGHIHRTIWYIEEPIRRTICRKLRSSDLIPAAKPSESLFPAKTDNASPNASSASCTNPFAPPNSGEPTRRAASELQRNTGKLI
ncbi:hypothetical protein L484_020773 [Morus notabilis]|uniref:Uncharacterized protein n=1 Tax=Morus notabilis TaxID=981085 RepID=W9RUZ2_9ROSA|nr:hypothetical protein L484_020773 [Morus notabilis]